MGAARGPENGSGLSFARLSLFRFKAVCLFRPQKRAFAPPADGRFFIKCRVICIILGEGHKIDIGSHKNLILVLDSPALRYYTDKYQIST